MATLSLRDVAERCLGLTGDISVNTDVYGYIHRGADGSLFGALGEFDVLPGEGTPASPTARSLRRHLETVSGVSVDLVVRLVGHEPGFSGAVTRDQATRTQYALQVARDLFATVDFGIRKITWQRLSVAEAGDFLDIENEREAKKLLDQFSGPPGGIDVFMVQTIRDAGGLSPTDGPVDKAGKRSGVVVPLVGASPEARTRHWTGVALAHEIGHYLGLGHSSSRANLMCGVFPFAEDCHPSLASVDITPSQGAEMKEHETVNRAC